MLPIRYIAAGENGIVMGPYTQAQLRSLLPPCALKKKQKNQYILKFSRDIMSSEDAEADLTFHEEEYPSSTCSSAETERIIMPLARYSMQVLDVLDLFGIGWRVDSKGTITIFFNKKKKFLRKKCLEWFHGLFTHPENGYVTVEVQPYGGNSFFHVLTDKTVHWDLESILFLWKTWVMCLRACVHLIDAGYFLSDLKTENMVFNPHGLYLIDTSIIHRKVFIEKFRKGKPFSPIMTLSPHLSPRQVLNKVFYKEEDLEHLTRLYDSRCAIDGRLQFSSLLEGLRVDVSEEPRPVPSICDPRASRSWPANIPIAQALKELSLLNVFYPMLLLMLLFLKQQVLYFPGLWVLREACAYPLLRRMKGYSPRTLLNTLEKLGDDRLPQEPSRISGSPMTLRLLEKIRDTKKKSTRRCSKDVTGSN
jgi:hypothetical protein